MSSVKLKLRSENLNELLPPCLFVAMHVARYTIWVRNIAMKQIIVDEASKGPISNCSDIRPTWPSAAAAATALHPVSITSHRKPARKMSLKSKSVPFSDLSPGLSREMLQWRQYAMHLMLTRAPPDGLVTFTPRAWAVVHHHHEGDSWFLLTRHSDSQTFPTPCPK